MLLDSAQSSCTPDRESESPLLKAFSHFWFPVASSADATSGDGADNQLQEHELLAVFSNCVSYYHTIWHPSWIFSQQQKPSRCGHGGKTTQPGPGEKYDKAMRSKIGKKTSVNNHIWCESQNDVALRKSNKVLAKSSFNNGDITYPFLSTCSIALNHTDAIFSAPLRVGWVPS